MKKKAKVKWKREFLEILEHGQIRKNNTITDGGEAPQCTFARPTSTHREHIDTR